MLHWIALLTPALFFTSLVSARSYNVTIDDQMGDPTTGKSIVYSPADVWNDGQSCDRCTAKPSPGSNAYMGTWKDATFNPPADIISATVPFIGTAVYVNCILTGSTDNPDGNTDMTFKIDNVTVGTFERPPNGDEAYQFGTTVFSMTGLQNDLHTFTLESGHAGEKALVLLDSIIYTKEVDDDLTSSRINLPSIAFTRTASLSTESASSSAFAANVSSKSSAVIAGSVVGGAVAMTTIFSIVFLCYRRQRQPWPRLRTALDTSDLPKSSSPNNPYSPYANSPSHLLPENRISPFVISVPSVPTLAPGDSVSQANSDHTSDWTSNSGRRTFRERARAFSLSRGRVKKSPMKVQNVTEADLQGSDVYEDVKPPPYLPSKIGSIVEKR